MKPLEIFLVVLFGFILLNVIICLFMSSYNRIPRRRVSKFVAHVLPGLKKQCHRCLVRKIVNHWSPKKFKRLTRADSYTQQRVLSALFKSCHKVCPGTGTRCSGREGGYKCVPGNNANFQCVYSPEGGSTLGECKRVCPGV